MTQKTHREYPSLMIALALGLISAVMQVLALRELLSFTRGNELVFILALGVWLVLVALGGGVGDILTRKLNWFESRGRWAIIFTVVASCILPISVIFGRFLPGIMGFNMGESLGASSLLVASLLYFAIPCLILGMTFPLAARLYREQGGATLAYLWEGLGAMAGGIGLVVAFKTNLDAISIACTMGAIGCVMTAPLSQMQGSTAAVRTSTAPALLLLLISISGLSTTVDDFSRQMGSYPQYTLVQNTYTSYSNLIVVSRQGELSLFENGLLINGFNAPENREPLPHIALALTRYPKRVLMIGGGPEGMVEEALRHNPTNLDYLELDERKQLIARTPLNCMPEDNRIHLLTGDPRRYLAESSSIIYDTIIFASGEPITLVNGRLSTVEALRSAASRLTDDGVLALQIHGAVNYLPPTSATYAASVIKALEEVFPKVEFIPGNPLILLAYKNADHELADANLISRTLNMRGIDTVYLTRDVLWNSLEPLRKERFEHAIDQAKSGAVTHTDLSPAAFATDWMRWSEMMDDSLAPVKEEALPRWLFMMLPLIPSIALVVFGRIFSQRQLRGASVAWITGYTSFMASMLIFFVFQIAIGSLFLNLALLNALFMLGLGLGAFLGRRSRGARAALISAALLSLPLILLPNLLPWLEFAETTLATGIMLLVATLAGSGTGAGFAAASGTALGRNPGVIYAADVAGAAMAALWGAFILLPNGGLVSLVTSGLALVVALVILAIWEWISYRTDPYRRPELKPVDDITTDYYE